MLISEPVARCVRCCDEWQASQREAAMKAHVDRNICIGSGNCVATAPNVFELDNEGLSHVVHPENATDDILQEVAEGCPVEAIILEDDDGNQVYP
jgi:ferredoxin